MANILGGARWGAYVRNSGVMNPFPKGNRLAATENLTPEQHQRKMRGLFKAWAVRERQDRGERVMTAETKQKIQRAKRTRLRENLQSEVREIQSLARSYAVQAMEKLADIVENSAQDSSVIAAAQVIFERAYGKATQTSINANIDANGKPTEVTSKELDTRIAETLKRVESLTGRAAEAETSEVRPPDVCVSDRDPGNSSFH